MIRTFASVITGLMIFAGTLAYAETTITLEPTVTTKIKEYVVKENVKPVTIQENLVVGATVPADVELVAVSEPIYSVAPTLKTYKYFYWNGRVVFVEPTTRKVVYIVE